MTQTRGPPWLVPRDHGDSFWCLLWAGREPRFFPNYPGPSGVEVWVGRSRWGRAGRCGGDARSTPSVTTTAVPRPVPVCPQARISGTRLFFPRPFFGPHKWDSPRGLDTSATSCSAGATGTQRGHGEWCVRPSEGCVVLPLVQGTPSRPCPHPPGVWLAPPAPGGHRVGRRKWGAQPGHGATPTASKCRAIRGGCRQGGQSPAQP